MFIADSVNCVISQRLVRKVCSVSREEYEPNEVERRQAGIPEGETGVKLARGLAADCNFHTGYLGRTGVFEVLSIDGGMRQAVIEGISAGELRMMALRNGMQSLEESARRKIRAQITTLEEMHRVLTSD